MLSKLPPTYSVIKDLRIVLPIVGTCEECGDPEGIDIVEKKIVCLRCLVPAIRAQIFRGPLN